MRVHLHSKAGASRPQTGWLVLLLLLAALVPSVCLVWFMNQAVRNEKLAVRQELMEVYRGNLSLAQGRLESWRAEKILAATTNHPPYSSLFASLVRSGLADSVICYDASNQVAYPSLGYSKTASTEASRLQAEARRLNAAGKTAELLALATNAKTNGALVDADGRLVMPDLELLVLERTNSSTVREALLDELNNYSNNMPSAQRLFLMRQFTDLFHNDCFPTSNAEALAAQFLEGSHSNLLTVSAGNGRLLLLFTKQTVERQVYGAPAGIAIHLLGPNDSAANYLLATAAGDAFPGWQLGLRLDNPNSFDAAAQAQVASYVWIGALTVAAVILLAVLGAQLIRHQAAVARLRTDLLANVTHELKTPLSSMRLLVDTLLNSQPLNEKTAREYLQLIATENNRLSRLIDNFLTFSRIERNKRVFDFTKVPAAQITQRAAAAVRERFLSGGCDFVVEESAALPEVFADADALVTVLLNLLDNAWKYSGEEKQITLSTAAQNGTVVFSVKDNGIGLKPRETRRIFNRFYQVDQGLARTGGGCGLGLSIVQYIVEAHHGSVRVESEPGRGSTFFVALPVAQEVAT